MGARPALVMLVAPTTTSPRRADMKKETSLNITNGPDGTIKTRLDFAYANGEGFTTTFFMKLPMGSPTLRDVERAVLSRLIADATHMLDQAG